MIKKTMAALHERVKELTCLHGISQIASNPRGDPGERVIVRPYGAHLHEIDVSKGFLPDFFERASIIRFQCGNGRSGLRAAGRAVNCATH